jgi:two-component sensor histidine kinase
MARTLGRKLGKTLVAGAAALRSARAFRETVMQMSHWLERPFTADTLALLSSPRFEQKSRRAPTELEAALGREAALRREMSELARRQVMLAQEFEHRLINGLQMISSLLSIQSRKARTSDAANQLAIAASRVAALGRVHRRLHLLDNQDRVEFKRYLEDLCEDLSRLLREESGDCAVIVEGASAEIPTALAIPLGFIVNELITNSAKHAKGIITVRFETTAPDCYSLSVLDSGPGLPAQYEPAGSNGLGMKIVQALVKQIGGELRISAAREGRGARFTVAFSSASGNGATH